MITDKDRIEKEKLLAELLGWKIKCVGDVATGWYDSAGNYQSMCPAWTRDNAAAFALMVEHDVYPDNLACGKKMRAGYWLDGDGEHMAIDVDVADHPSKEAAVMYAIVCAAIAKLETTKPVVEGPLRGKDGPYALYTGQ